MSASNGYEYASSSPSSSPVLAPSSSPSPFDVGMEEDDFESAHSSDPFAGSFRHRTYKRASSYTSSDNSSPPSTKRARHCGEDDEDILEQEHIWSTESTRAYDTGTRIFHLSEQGLSFISLNFIADLKKMVILPNLDAPTIPSRTNTNSRHLDDPQTPGVAARHVRKAFARIESKNSAVVPGEKDHNIHLYLSKNMITKLPNELWTLENLTNLSLMNNKITYLPPEIGRMKNLRVLNVAVNHLKYLPSELNNLRLFQFTAYPNKHFLPKPDKGPLVSRTEFVTESAVPSLVELAFRAFGAPPPPTWDEGGQNVLDYYGAEEFERVSEHLLQTLHACAPELIHKPAQPAKSRDRTGFSRCGNPAHTTVFVQHAEQRYTWENRVAGVFIGGGAPLQWRGCCRGCLDFLDATMMEEVEVEFGTVALGGNGIEDLMDDD